MSALLITFVCSIIASTKARPCNLQNPCEAYICRDVRWSCETNFDACCECEMFDECEGYLRPYLPRGNPCRQCIEGYYVLPPVNPPPVNPPAVNPPPVNPPAVNPGSLV